LGAVAKAGVGQHQQPGGLFPALVALQDGLADVPRLVAWIFLKKRINRALKVPNLVLAHIEDHLSVQDEVVVTEEVADAFGPFPVDFRKALRQIELSDAIQLFELLPNCDQHHCDSIEAVDPVITGQEILGAFDAGGSTFDALDGCSDVGKDLMH
jgi:hypothetical protein